MDRLQNNSRKAVPPLTLDLASFYATWLSDILPALATWYLERCNQEIYRQHANADGRIAANHLSKDLFVSVPKALYGYRYEPGQETCRSFEGLKACFTSFVNNESRADQDLREVIVGRQQVGLQIIAKIDVCLPRFYETSFRLGPEQILPWVHINYLSPDTFHVP